MIERETRKLRDYLTFKYLDEELLRAKQSSYKENFIIEEGFE